MVSKRASWMAAFFAMFMAATPIAAWGAGAMAVGNCGAFGYAIDFVDPAQASATALTRCNGQGCTVAMTMKKTCAAFAIDAANACGAHGYATARRLAPAQNAALKSCYKYGGKTCVIRAFACDGKG